MTSTGSASASRCPSARPGTRPRFRCQHRSGKRSWITCATVARRPKSGACSFGRSRRSSRSARRWCQTGRGATCSRRASTFRGRGRTRSGTRVCSGSWTPTSRSRRSATSSGIARRVRRRSTPRSPSSRCAASCSAATASRCCHEPQRDHRVGGRAVPCAQARSGRKYHTEEEELRLLVRYAADHAALRLDDLTPVLLDGFLRSRPRARPRSFNALLGVLARLLDWAVSQQLLASSPLRARRRRATSARIPFLFDPLQARRLLDAAGALADDAHAPHRGATYRTLFALCYGLGLRVGEACGLSLGDVDGERDLLVVRAGKFGKSRLVPHGPRIAALLEEQLERRH